jgi:hypothetical protein
MYKKFKEITISKHHVFLEFNNEETRLFEFPDVELKFLSRSDIFIVSNETLDSMGIIKNKIWLTHDTESIDVPAPNEFRYCVNKSLKKNKEFSLNYRKHLRSKFDVRHIQVLYMPECWQLIEDKKETIKQIYKMVSSEYGEGVEKRPFIIFGRGLNDDMHYKVIKNNDIVSWGCI